MVFACCQNGVQISVGEENSSFDEIVCWLFRDLFHSYNQVLSKVVAAELLDEFVIVDLFVCGT